MRKENGDIELIVLIIITVVIIGLVIFSIFKSIYSRTAGNKTAIDLKYKYEKAIVYMNGEKLELDIDTWSDYDGEQLQIITKDGTVYLISSFNTILIGE